MVFNPHEWTKKKQTNRLSYSMIPRIDSTYICFYFFHKSSGFIYKERTEIKLFYRNRKKRTFGEQQSGKETRSVSGDSREKLQHFFVVYISRWWWLYLFRVCLNIYVSIYIFVLRQQDGWRFFILSTNTQFILFLHTSFPPLLVGKPSLMR